MLYEITAAEDLGIRKKAEERQLNKEARQVTSKIFDPSKSDLQIHLEGMRAEFAAAKLLGASLNWELLIGGDNNRGDLTLSDGRSVSVKFRKKRGWDFALYSANPDEFKEDIGVLVYPSDTHYRALDVFGWITREDFLKNSTVRNYKYGDRLIVGPTLMSPILRLIAELKKSA